MSQASATKLIPKLRFKLHNRRNLKSPEGAKGRHDKIKKTITALFKHERIEMNYGRADESRGYAERLISDAIRYGDTHKPTMEMASYWIIDKPVIHKLFKVLAPRYRDFTLSYTKLWHAPKNYPGHGIPKCVLELRNNIYPPLGPDKSHNKNLIHNVLLEEAKRAYREEKALKAKAKMIEEQNKASVSNASQPDMKENIQMNATDVESVEKSETVDENNLSSEEDLKGDGESESKEKSDENISGGEDLDLNKLKIEEEKQVESPSEKEK